MGRLVVPPIRGGGGVGRPHFDSSENQGGEEEGEILAGGAGGVGGAAVGWGRRDNLEDPAHFFKESSSQYSLFGSRSSNFTFPFLFVYITFTFHSYDFAT